MKTDKQQYKCILISDFNLQNFSGFLMNDDDSPGVDVQIAPYGQVTSILMQSDSACWQSTPDIAIVWTGFLEKTNEGLKVFKPRLPRTATDQTASLLYVKNENPVSVILENLRWFKCM